MLGEVLPLSASLPVFENLGLKVIAEDSYPVSFNSDGGWRQDAAILDFTWSGPTACRSGWMTSASRWKTRSMPCLRGDAESDGFNRLVMGAGLAWRDVTILRAAAKFLRQAAITFSRHYMQQALVRNPDVAALLVALFHARNDPPASGDRAAAVLEIEQAHRDGAEGGAVAGRRPHHPPLQECDGCDPAHQLLPEECGWQRTAGHGDEIRFRQAG